MAQGAQEVAGGAAGRTAEPVELADPDSSDELIPEMEGLLAVLTERQAVALRLKAREGLSLQLARWSGSAFPVRRCGGRDGRSWRRCRAFWWLMPLDKQQNNRLSLLQHTTTGC